MRNFTSILMQKYSSLRQQFLLLYICGRRAHGCDAPNYTTIPALCQVFFPKKLHKIFSQISQNFVHFVRSIIRYLILLNTSRGEASRGASLAPSTTKRARPPHMPHCSRPRPNICDAAPDRCRLIFYKNYDIIIKKGFLRQRFFHTHLTFYKNYDII